MDLGKARPRWSFESVGLSEPRGPTPARDPHLCCRRARERSRVRRKDSRLSDFIFSGDTWTLHDPVKMGSLPEMGHDPSLKGSRRLHVDPSLHVPKQKLRVFVFPLVGFKGNLFHYWKYVYLFHWPSHSHSLEDFLRSVCFKMDGFHRFQVASLLCEHDFLGSQPFSLES